MHPFLATGFDVGIAALQARFEKRLRNLMGPQPENGANSGIRTQDLRITNALLYQLS